MYRRITTFFTVVALVILRAGFLARAEPPPQEREFARAVEAVSPAVIRIEVANDRGHCDVGVIVTADGYILSGALPHLHGKPLLFVLPDGRKPRGVLLGWSEEWAVSLAKITDVGPWPFVEMSTDSPDVKQSCFGMGYRQVPDGWQSTPDKRAGVVTALWRTIWFSSSLQQDKPEDPVFQFGPVFGADGKLLGTTSDCSVVHGSNHLQSRQIKALWSDLLQPVNLDKQRLLHFDEPAAESLPYRVAAGTPLSEREVEDRIAACTVRLRDKSGGTWSGVLVSPDGHIATCAHGTHLPGDKLTVEFADGRDVAGVVHGVNRVSDIALAKIIDQGVWPSAPLAKTTDISPGTACWVVGYPEFRRNERTPLVRKTTIENREEPEWSYMLYTNKDSDQWSGDSGGGVFDAAGRLLAITEGKEPGHIDVGRHPRIEVLRRQWKELENSPELPKRHQSDR